MDTDDRFKHLASDPRFKTLRRKQRKVQIDERFASMFTDERFTLKYKQDKRGNRQVKTSGDDLRQYYHLESEKKLKDKEESQEDIEEEERDEDEEELEQEDDLDSEDDLKNRENPGSGEDSGEDSEETDEPTESEVSSSSDESESEDEDNAGRDVDVEKIQYDWEPLDHDAERADIVTKRIAIQNLDWNHLDVKDIYTLVNSVRPPLSVKIYVSEFGKERLAKEEVEGPLELAEMPQIDEDEEEYQRLEDQMQALENKGKKRKINEYEDADEMLDSKNEQIRERLRRYQLSQMKYYYAIAEFDSPESAQAVYKELDGIEYEGSSLELDLRYVPDDMKFDPADVKATCDKVPDQATYKAPQFINSALQQTTVKFTWDETDVKRQEKLHKAFTKEELEKDDLDVYLASETDSDDEDEEDQEDGEKSETMTVMTGNSEARINKYRQLLKSLDEEAERKKKVDIDVEWGDFEGDEKKLATGDSDVDDDDDDDYDDDDSDDDDNENEEEDSADEEENSEGDEDDEDEEGEDDDDVDEGNEDVRSKRKKVNFVKKKRVLPEPDADLDLLVMDVNARKEKEFKFDPDDTRFKAIYESGLYNIDPSHPNFKRTEAINQIAERKREKRRKKMTIN